MGHVKSPSLSPFFVRARFALPASYLGTMSVHLNNLQLCLYVCLCAFVIKS